MGIKVLIALNTAWNLFNFRAGLIRALVAEGYEVVAVAPPDEYASRLTELGCRYVPIEIDNQGTHPVKDLLLFARFWELLRRERPSIYFGYTVKPNVYGSLAAHALGIPVVNNIAGLGAVFIRKSWVTRVVRSLYRVALSRSRRVFFQNSDDCSMFVESGLVRKEVIDILPGSGIDLSRFQVVPLPSAPTVRFLLIARMLWDKGIGEFIEAARLLKARGINAEFFLLGFLDVQNPTAIQRAHMDDWTAEGLAYYLGVSDDVRVQIAEADCVVLPSYREGTPRTLLEAAAMGRPIITTDAVGCRNVVDDEITGYLCRVSDAADLAEKMGKMASLSAEKRKLMGESGRKKIECEYDERLVIQKYLKVINEVAES